MIDITSKITESQIAETARIYKNVIVRKCEIGENCIIGDFGHVEDSVLEQYTQIYPFGTMYSSRLGAYSYVQKNSSIWHANIGKFCSLSWNVSVGGGEHDFHKVTAHSFLYSKSYGFIEEPLYERFADKCEIGNDVWIAAGASILRGVTMGDGAVVGAGAIVTKDVPPYSIVAGVPAKVIGYRCNDEIIADLLELKWWNWPCELIRHNVKLFNQDLNRETVNRLIEIGKEIKK